MNVPSSSTTAPRKQKSSAVSMATGEGVNTAISITAQSVAVVQFDNNSNKRQPIMLNIHLIHEARTEHAKAVRRLIGTNDFRDKEWHLRKGCLMQCIGTFLTTDNLIVLCYE